MAARATGNWFDRHGRSKGEAQLYVNRAHTAGGEPIGDVYLSIEVGKRLIDVSMAPEAWAKLHQAAGMRLDDEAARKLAEDIKARRNGLNNEDALAEGIELRNYARAKKHSDEDRARINGMVIALTYMLGRPFDMKLAEEFIQQTGMPADT